MGCILNAVLFIALFAVIIVAYIVVTMWNQIMLFFNMLRGVKNSSAGRQYGNPNQRQDSNKKNNHKTSNPPTSQNKIFTKDQGEYVDFEEVP